MTTWAEFCKETSEGRKKWDREHPKKTKSAVFRRCEPMSENAERDREELIELYRYAAEQDYLLHKASHDKKEESELIKSPVYEIVWQIESLLISSGRSLAQKFDAISLVIARLAVDKGITFTMISKNLESAMERAEKAKGEDNDG